MNRHVNSISGRLSLRSPQRQSLEILNRVMEIAKPNKNTDLKEALSIIQSEFSTVEDFERAFPNLCFALATGVGKTRLMGAFIAYLHLEHGIRHFFVLAPNLTIYNKLIADFTPNTPKYVFQGIAEFAVNSPHVVTGDNYEDFANLLDYARVYDVTINIFNISKFNTKTKEARKAWRLSEFLGQSYFDYLAGLDDLVLIMDEAHRYRADSSMQSVEELKPILGLELTATPQVEGGKHSGRFKNIILDYPLANAMHDGYVKEPAVATRANFDPKAMSASELERLKLEDGIRVHEAAKVDLEVYAQQNDEIRVKPFMLVVASDTQHADDIVKTIESDQFFEGRYKGRVIQVHSGQRGAEKDENIERLLSVERTDEPTEVVVHVNMLKEGWDVTNLYTIVPLRAADSRTLVEQSIGRGLRLPYGRRTGIPAVDRLTIIAHDRFQDIVDEAKRGGYSFSTINIGVDVPDTPKKTVVVAPVVESVLGLLETTQAGLRGETTEIASVVETTRAQAPKPKFATKEEIVTAKAALEAIRKITRTPNAVSGAQALESEEIQKQIATEVNSSLKSTQMEMYPTVTEDKLANVIKEVTTAYISHTIAIPRVIVLPKGEVRAGFHEFTLNLSSFHLQPVSDEILVQHLASEIREKIAAIQGGAG